MENNIIKNNIGIIDVGGGFRDIFGAGVFDYLLDNKIYFNDLIGISAGANNVLSYLSHQPRRNLIYYLFYGFRYKYMSFRNFIRVGHYLDYDYIYNYLGGPKGEFPLDYETFKNNPANFTIVTTNAITGEPGYFTKERIKQFDTRVLRASGTLPFVSEPQYLDEQPHFDGGIANPIPIKYAQDVLGWEKIILILTRERDYYRDPNSDKRTARFFEKSYPNFAKALINRAETYNRELDYAKELEKEGKCLIIAPNDTMHLKTLSRNRKALSKLYLDGYKQARKILPFVESN